MTDLKLKLRLLFLPFLLIAISFVCTYTFLHWLLIIKTGWIDIKEEIAQLWLPATLSFIPVLIWIYPRLRLLNFKTKKADLSTLYVAVAAAAIIATTLFAQLYLTAATGKLSILSHINELKDKEKTKYYKLRQYYIDTTNAVWHANAEVRGKNNKDLHFALFAAVPILGKEADTAEGVCSYWLGIKYQLKISNRLEQAEKDSLYTEFADKCAKSFRSTDHSQFTYLEKLGNTEDHDAYNVAINTTDLIVQYDPEVFIASKEVFDSQEGRMLAHTFIAFGISSFVWLVMISVPKLKKNELKKGRGAIRKKQDELSDALSLFIPKAGYCATPIIINLNMLVFIVMVFAGLGFIQFKAVDLLSWGANCRPFVHNGQWWRLLTSVFLHTGLMHILLNMFSLAMVGIFLEPVLGTKRFAIFYLVCGVLAGVASLAWHIKISAGASGAIFGMYGMLIGLSLMKVFSPGFGKRLLIGSLIFIGYNLIMGLAGGIDNAAHTGGLVSGFLIGVIVAGPVKREQSQTI